jgi:electron transfer flavoprotein alpha subunit
MAVMLVADHDGGVLKDATHKAVTAALALSRDGAVDILVAGEGCGAVADAAAKLNGVRTVLCSDGPSLKHQGAEALQALIVPLMGDYDTVAFVATTTGKNAAPRIAAALDCSLISDIVAVVAPDTFIRPIYAGNALETIQTAEAKRVVTIRATAFAAAAPTGNAGRTDVAAPAAPAGVSFVREERAVSARPELAGAKIVVSGGRAMGSAENFKLVEGFADKLGAAVGASRAAVDAGYAPNDYQVGQTGKVVAPELYIALGISGAIQHLAGMKDSKVIVAVNKDPEAPIFSVADYGLVADLFTAVPQIEAELAKQA